MKPSKLYHCTTPRKVKQYNQTGTIISPVRSFDSLQGALAWCVKTGRTVILEIDGWLEEDIHKLPDHHNNYATAYWVDKNITSKKCVFSAEKDA